MRKQNEVEYLQEGDVIEVTHGMKVYANVPKHFLYSNCKGDFTMGHGEAKAEGELEYLAGKYIVVRTVLEGGGTGHGPHDVYPDGWHVTAEKVGNRKQRISFYQSGCFTVMHPNLKPVGKAVQKWMINGKEV